MALIDPFDTTAPGLVDPYAPVAPERGLVGETVAAVKRGGVRTLEMLGQAAKAVDPVGGIDVVRGAGEGIAKYAQERMRKADLAESTYAETHPILGNIPQGAEMLVSSVGVPLAAAGGIAAAGVSAPVAIAGGGLTAGALFGLSQFTDTKERAIGAGLSEEDANKAATKTALIEGGGEALSNVIPIGKMLKLGKPAAGNVIKSLFGAATTKDVAKNLANNTLQIMGGEVTTEMAQTYGQATVERDAGIRPDADPWAEAKDVIGPTIALSIMTGGVVGAANKLSRVATQRALQNEKVGADARTSAAMGVYESLVNAEKAGTAPAGSAENFRAHSAAAIKNKAPLVLSDDLLKPLVAAPKTSNESMKEALTEALALAADPSNDMGITDAIKATNERKVSERLAANATENLDKIDQQIIDLTEEVVAPAPVAQIEPPYTDAQAEIMRKSVERGKVTVLKEGPMPWQIAWADENGLEITKVGSTPSASGSSVTRDWRIIPKEVQDATQEGVGREGVRTELGGVEEVPQGEGTRGVVPEAIQETGIEAGLGDSVLPATQGVRPSEAQAGPAVTSEEVAPVTEPAAPKVVRRRKAAAQAASEVAPEPVAEAEAVEPAAERPTPGGPPVFVAGTNGREEAVQVDRDGERVVWAWRGGRKNEWFADVKADLLADGETVDLNTVDVPIEFRKDAARAFQAAGFKIKGATIKMMERGKTDERGQLTTKILDSAAKEDQGSRLQTASAELRRMVSPKLYDRKTTSPNTVKKREAEVLRAWAADNGVLSDGAAFAATWDSQRKPDGTRIKGNEHDVIFNGDGTVTKRNHVRGEYHESYKELFDRVTLFNWFFGDSVRLELTGFQDVDGVLMPEFKQANLGGGVSPLHTTEAFLAASGFEPVGGKTTAYRIPGTDIIITNVFGENTRMVDGQAVPMDYVILHGERAKSWLVAQEKQPLEFSFDEAAFDEGFDATMGGLDAKKTGEEVGEQVQEGAGIVAEERAGQTPERVQDTAESISTRTATERLAHFNRMLSSSATVPTPMGAMKPSTNSKLIHQLETIARIFGLSVTVIAPSADVRFDGFVHPSDPKHIYVSENADNPHMAVFGHELVHQLRMADEGLFQQLQSELISNSEGGALESYFKKVFGTTDAAQALKNGHVEEWTGDIVGHVLTKQSFWDAFYADQPIAAARIADAVRKLLDMIKNFVTTGRIGLASSTIKDFKAVERNVADVLKKYSKLQRSKGLDPEYRLDFKMLERDAQKPEFKFIEKLSNPTDTEAVQDGLSKWFKAATTGGRAVKDLAANLASHIMHIDRTIRMAESLKDYAPIRTNLKTLRMQRQEMAGYRQSFLYDGAVIMKRKAEAFKTAAEQKAFADMMFAASRYELHAADPSKDTWNDYSWRDAGMDKITGKTLGQAKAEVAKLYAAAVKTDAQKAVHHDMLNELKKLYLEGFNAQLAPQELVYGKDTVAKAVEFVRKRKEGQPVPAKMKDIVDAIAPIVNGYPMLQGDYVPFSRLGKYIVRTFETEEGQDAKRVRTEAFDSKQAAIDRVNEVNSLGGNLRAEAEEQADYGRDVVNVPADILDKLRAAAEARGIDGEKLEALMQDAARIRATTIPRGSVVGNKLQRQGVEGYNTDLDRVFADYVSRHANSNTRLIYGSKLEQTYRDMRNDVKAYTSDPEHDAESAINMTTLINKLYELEQQSGKDKVYDAVKLVGKATFAWYLSSPSIWLVQWTQPLMVTIPKLASKYGIRKASGEYMKATKEYLSGAYSDEKIDAFNRAEGNIGEQVVDMLRKRQEAEPAEVAKIDAQLKHIFGKYDPAQQKLLTLKVMALRGEIDLTLSHSMQDLITGATKGEQVFNAGVDKLAYFMKHSETGSRRAAAVSSFNLALAEGKSIADAADYASDVVNDTLFNMDSHNKGEFWRGNAGHLLGQFQSFRMGMLGKLMQLAKDAHGAEFDRLIDEAENRGDTKGVEEAMTAKREARRELAFMVGMTFSLAGAAGTPVAMAMSNPVTEALWAGLSFLFGDDDDPVDLKREFEMAVRDSLGETAGTAVLKGLPAVFGLDISNRVGMGGLADVVMGEPPAGLTGTAKANWYAGRLLGPTWGMVSDGIRGMDAMAEGDLGKAIQYTSPKVVRDAVKTVDLATEGVQGGGKTILQAEDVSPWSMALMLVGINPSEVSLAQTESRYLRNISASLSSRRSQLIRDVAKANAAGDLDAQTEALEAINEWSSKQPQLKVTQEELARGIKRELDKRAGRLTDRERLIKEEYGGE